MNKTQLRITSAAALGGVLYATGALSALTTFAATEAECTGYGYGYNATTGDCITNTNNTDSTVSGSSGGGSSSGGSSNGGNTYTFGGGSTPSTPSTPTTTEPTTPSTPSTPTGVNIGQLPGTGAH